MEGGVYVDGAVSADCVDAGRVIVEDEARGAVAARAVRTWRRQRRERNVPAGRHADVPEFDVGGGIGGGEEEVWTGR